jgi:hypothetical protein
MTTFQTPEDKKIEELKAQLAKALDALNLAEGIMSFSRGDAYERECTDNDYDAFKTIYKQFRPPKSVASTWSKYGPGYTNHGAEIKVSCPHCGKMVGGVNGIKMHIRAKHQPTTWFKS